MTAIPPQAHSNGNIFKDNLKKYYKCIFRELTVNFDHTPLQAILITENIHVKSSLEFMTHLQLPSLPQALNETPHAVKSDKYSCCKEKKNCSVKK